MRNITNGVLGSMVVILITVSVSAQSGGPFQLQKSVIAGSGGRNVVKQLKPISFEWKDGSGHDIGLAAEDVARVAPSLAMKDKQGVVTGVRYERLNILLINAVKEQQAQIETQQKQVIQQQKQIATLLTANAALNMRVRAVEKRLPKKRGSARRHR